MASSSLKVAFVHPDLGIGGAERLVVDAAVGLQEKGHNVVIYTSHHDPNHCFEETRDGTLRVETRGDTIVPTSIFGGMRILCSVLRCLHLALSMLWDGSARYDVLFVDQQSACVPILKLTGAKIFFYCHFPDKLLTNRESVLKRVYRWPFDRLEELTTGMADMIAVNSQFTKTVYRDAFPTLKRSPEVVYPAIRFGAYDQVAEEDHRDNVPLKTGRRKILSINRFERKKNIPLAIKAFRDYKIKTATSKAELVIAGGYDTRVTENVEHHKELETLAQRLDLSTFTIWSNADRVPKNTDVIFLPSFSEKQRTYLLAHSDVLLYTPSNEHFGIVPVEAMYARIPVIAVDSGGPKETVLDGETGFLCQPTVESFGKALVDVMAKSEERVEMGEKGRAHVQNCFSLEKFVDSLDGMLRRLVSSENKDE